MTNPYGHSGYTDSEEVAREKTLGAIEWQREEIKNAMRQNMSIDNVNQYVHVDNPYDVDALREKMVTAQLMDLSIHVEQLQQHVTDLDKGLRSANRCLKWIAAGAVFFGVVLLFIAWMSR